MKLAVFVLFVGALAEGLSSLNREKRQAWPSSRPGNTGLSDWLIQSFQRSSGRRSNLAGRNPLYQRQAQAAGDNHVVNMAPTETGYTQCPPGIRIENCVYNPCPKCRDFHIECWTNPCGGCTGEMYKGGRRIHDCETI